MTGNKAVSCQKILLPFFCLPVTCQQSSLSCTNAALQKWAQRMNCNKLVYKGRKGLGRHCNLNCIWYDKRWATVCLYLTPIFYIEASCSFSCCFDGVAQWCLGTHGDWEGGPMGDWSPRDTLPSLTLLSARSMTQAWRWELFSYESWWAAIPIT